MRNSSLFTASAVIAVLVSSGAGAQSGIEPPMELLAAQLRTQGYECDRPESAHPDPSASKPNERVWIVRCKGVDYRMTVVPDMAAKIEKIGN
ncbi:MAG TPA: hypothetical protein PKE16_20415 [Hyphomicrobium sp.]|nr:hypothetical protein [Hyphomicrobium sp.]